MVTAIVNAWQSGALRDSDMIRALQKLDLIDPADSPDEVIDALRNQAYDHNEAQKSDPANLTKTGRLKKKARLVDGMDIKAPPGYTGGRFRGNWQVSFDAPAADETGRVDKTGNLTKAAGNYTLSLFKVGMKAIYFCNNVPYAYRLEMGHSSQAPGGMVRITAAEFQRFFEDAVREVTK
ncbi:hypothetical protein [Enterobacter sp.]|uniref:hypothetical protein n=1 Tax=Enterobacter sp. TaxID=42895 RepID=UPI0031D7AF97